MPEDRRLFAYGWPAAAVVTASWLGFLASIVAAALQLPDRRAWSEVGTPRPFLLAFGCVPVALLGYGTALVWRWRAVIDPQGIETRNPWSRTWQARWEDIKGAEVIARWHLAWWSTLLALRARGDTVRLDVTAVPQARELIREVLRRGRLVRVNEESSWLHRRELWERRPPGAARMRPDQPTLGRHAVETRRLALAAGG